MIQAGQTASFIVSFDDSITLQNGYQTTGLALAQAVLASCENDLAMLSNLFGGIMPAQASLPFQGYRSRRRRSQPCQLLVDGDLLLYLNVR